MAYINIVKGDDTDFLGNQYLVVNFNTDLDLVGFKAIFKLGNFELTYPDLTAKYIEIILSKDVTSSLPKGKLYGTLQLIDTQDRVRTITTVLPFNVVTKVVATSQVAKNSIQLDVRIDKNELTIDMNIVGLSKVVAEGYLKQMEDYNSYLNSKILEVRDLEQSIENLTKEALDYRNEAEAWAESDSVLGEEGHSAKYYSNSTEETLGKTQQVYEDVVGLKNESAELLGEVGQLFDKALYKTQITNCLLEVPQRIKYTLVDGTLTILAGSVVIIPYGLEDLSEQYPVGSIFLDDNFKVVDTQWDGSKFFVWAELQNDVSKTSTDANEDLVVQFGINTTASEPTWDIIGSYGKNLASGTTPPTEYKLYYNTDTNKIFITANVNAIYTLPLMITTGAFGNIKQVFNGFGYIGSTVWVDKGVKGLIPSGRNADGSLNNIEYTVESLVTNTASSDVSQNYVLGLYSNGIFARRQQRYSLRVKTKAELANFDVSKNYFVYVEDENYFYISQDSIWYRDLRMIFATATFTEGVVSNFNSKPQARLVDNNMVDGQWVFYSDAPTVSSAIKIGTYTVDVSEYLPKDGSTYEVWAQAYLNRSDASGTNTNLYVRDVANNGVAIGAIHVVADGANFAQQAVSGLLVVDAHRRIEVIISGYNAATAAVYFSKYRRLGTNV